MLRLSACSSGRQQVEDSMKESNPILIIHNPEVLLLLKVLGVLAMLHACASMV
jgi:hypothetical protein